MDDQKGDDLPTLGLSDGLGSGLGWPSSGLGSGLRRGPDIRADHAAVMREAAVEGAAAQEAAGEAVVALEAGPPTDPVVSRETLSQGGVEHLSERDQLSASLPSSDDETPLARAVARDARRRLSLTGKKFPKPDRTRVLTVANQKGGVGKTTTAVNIAAGLAQAGLRVLVVDIDPQGNASTALGIDHHADVASIYDVLVDGKPIVDVMQECADIPNLWCVPATIDLAGAAGCP